MIIDITKLKRNTKILVETKNTIYEIKVVGPKSGTVLVQGGIKFIRETRAKVEGEIKKNEGIIFVDKKRDDTFLSSRVLSATIYAPDDSWQYDAIEKNENTN